MTCYSFHASHEQFSPAVLLELARQAEAAGFDGVFCSDHLQPWAPSQGHSGHAWVWLGAALQATQRLSFGTITVPGGWRYHPVVLAQSIATLCQMFPGRLPWIALGSGEAVNEQAMGHGWPSKAKRNALLREGADLVRALLSGERVSRRGHLAVDEARLWEVPEQAPQLFGAATSEATAHWLGGWSDGLLTLGRDLPQLERVIAAYRDGGGEGKPVHIKVDVSWAPDQAEALHQAHAHWRFNCLGSEINGNLAQPEQFEQASRFVRPEDMHEHVLIASDPAAIIHHLESCRALGVASIDVHQVGMHQQPFIELCGRSVLPVLRARHGRE